MTEAEIKAKIAALALDCAMKGIDLEETLANIMEWMQTLINPVMELAAKNERFIIKSLMEMSEQKT